MGQQPSKQSLFIKITLGQTQSHELFDFQNGGIDQESLVIDNVSYLLDKGETVQFLNQEEYFQIKDNNNMRQTSLLKVTVDPHKQIRIKNLSRVNNNTVLWRCVKPDEVHPIKSGDIIKIGKIKLELKKIVQRKQQSYLDQETVKDYHEEASEQQDDLESMRSGHSSCDRCRICFRSFNVKNDPLLCLCKCSGSIKWIHFLCLKDWIANNFSKRQDQHCKFYTYQQTNCQLCKHALPNQFKHEGRSYSFLDFSTFQPPYAEFQYVEEENNKKKYYKYIISLAKDKEVIIGRNNSSQVVMKDISISRTHCSLEYTHGVLLLRDKRSKFGTLIKLDKEVDFNSQSGLQLQYDSKIIELYNNNAFKSCCQDIDSYRLIYENEADRGSESKWGNNMSADGERRLMRVDGGSGYQPNQEQIVSSMQSHHYLNRAIQQAINLEQNSNNDRSLSHRDSARVTMIRQTIARDEAIRY